MKIIENRRQYSLRWHSCKILFMLKTQTPVLRLSPWLVIFMAIYFHALPISADLAESDVIKIGVLAKRGTHRAMQQWGQLANYLSTTLAGNRFVVVPLGFEEITQSVKKGDVDFILVNPYLYVLLEAKYGATAIATMRNRRMGKGYSVFGGVIFTRADRADIRDLSDLHDKTFMAVNPDSLGGYQMARLELKHHGIDIDKDMVIFGQTHDEVVYSVYMGEADAGTVRTDTLERMAKEGRIHLDDFRILHERKTEPEYDFPFVHSTKLYPEWPFAKTKHVPDELARRVTTALLDLPGDHPAAHSAMITGWTLPSNYQSVRKLLLELRIGPYSDPVMVLDFTDFLRAQVPVISATLAGLILLLFSTSYVIWLNKKLKNANDSLVNEIRTRKQLESALANEVSLLDKRVQERTREVERLRLYDPLTSLPNRLMLYDRVDHLLYIARKDNITISLLLIDINNFTEINNTLGHYHGDMLLIEIADRLRNKCEKADAICRFSGDQFAILLSAASLDRDISHIIVELLNVFAQPFRIEDAQIKLSISIGIAQFPHHGEDTDTLLRHAEIAMHVASRNQSEFAFYDPGYDEHSKRRLVMVSELEKAIRHDDLVLLYQPQLDVASGNLVGLEALVRWKHSEFGLLFPSQFIPVAEQTGLIRPLTQWVINAALRQCSAWNKQKLYPRVSVNLSTWNLHDGTIVKQIQELLDAWDVPPGCLEIEITESSMMLDRERARKVLSSLRNMGISISVDDFGTGYSSLSHLKQLPIDSLKIDQSFIHDFPDNMVSVAITRAIIQLSHSLSLKVVAEGVETKAMLDLLSELGCDIVQGFYFGKPMSPEEIFAKWLSADIS